MVKVPPWQCPSSASVPSQGAPGSSGWPSAPTAETGPLGAQSLPRVFELAASEAADFTAFDHSGATIAFLLHVFPASALTTIVLLGQVTLTLTLTLTLTPSRPPPLPPSSCSAR